MKVSSSETDEVTVLFQANATLAEGPLWDNRLELLYWIDIRRCRVSRFDPKKACQTGVWITPSRPGCISLTSDPNKLVVAAGADILILDLQSGAISALATLPIDAPTFRANDGCVDTKGRLWVGTMIDDINAPEQFCGGRIFRVDPDGSIGTFDIEFELPNGIGWSRDEAVMYVNDTTAQTTYCFDFDAPSGSLSNQRIFYDHSHGEGFPDGLSVDSDGCIWSSQWDGWNIRKISADGRLLEEFPMPVRRPSSATFFGPGMDRIVITSATVGFTTEDFLSSPDAGSLFSLSTDSKGVVENQFSLSAENGVSS